MTLRPSLRFNLSVLLGACLTALSLGGCNAPSTPSGSSPALKKSAIISQPDLTLASTSDAGVTAYTATLPVDPTFGTALQTLEGSWDSSLHGPSQPPVYPQSWTLDYFAGATKLSAPPTTPALWASVSRVVTSGTSSFEGADGNRQALISNITAPPIQVASSFSGGSAGDGWDTLFDTAYTRVYNLHHHDSPATLMCRFLKDSTTCPGYPIALTQTSTRATASIDDITNMLWQPTVTLNGQLAWDCVDLTASARCATPVVLSSFAARDTSHENHIDRVVIGRKLYSIGFTPDAARITCLDMATGTECNGVQLIDLGSSYGSGIDAIGNNIYALAQAQGSVQCFDSTTMAPCPGSWPQVTSATGRVHAAPSADGVLRDICADWQCWAADGTATTLSPNYLAYAAAHTEGALGANFPQYANMARGGTRVAWAADGSVLQCWDMAIDDVCAKAFPFPVSALYTAEFDPINDDCLWTNSDDGIIRNFQISTGAQGCSGGPPRISFRASVAIPRLGCDASSRVYQYKSFRLIAPDPALYPASSLTVINSTGAKVPGWVGIPFPDGGTVDLTTLSTALVGPTPIFSVAAPGFTDVTASSQAEFRVTGGTPQLCWNLSAPSPVCPATAGLAGNQTGTPQATSVGAKGSYAPDGGAVFNFTDQALAESDSIDPPNQTNCGAYLKAVVHLVDGTVAPGVFVSLLDGSGNPVLDAKSQPVSAISGSDGSVSFGVWVNGYELAVSDAPGLATVSMTINSGGSGTTNASNGMVTSGVVTTTTTINGLVAVVVNLVSPPAPDITAPGSDALLSSRTVAVQGGCSNGFTVTVSEGDALLCTAACVGSAYSCTTSPLADGVHAVVATQGSARGPSSPPSLSRSFSIDATAPAAPVIVVPAEGLVTNSRVLPLSGTCEAGASVTVFEGALTLCATTCLDGGFSCLTPPLADGPHVLLARQTDAAGNASLDAVRNVTIDTQSPKPPVITTPANNSVGNNTTPTISGLCETGDTVTVSDGERTACVTSCTAGAFSCISSSLAEGSHFLRARQTDAAGNQSFNSKGLRILVDITPPGLPVISAPLAGSYTANSAPVITGTCETQATVNAYEGETLLCSSVCTGGAFACTSAFLSDASHTVYTRQVDLAGNTSNASTAVTFTVDNALPPAPAFTAPAVGTYTNNIQPTLSGTCEGGALVKVFEASTLLCAVTCGDGTFSCVSPVLAEGTHTLIARQTDLAFSDSVDSDGLVLTIDTTSPIAAVIQAPADGVITASTAPTLSGLCEAFATVQVMEAGTTLCQVTCDATNLFVCTPTLPQGLHSVIARQADRAGNAAPDSVARAFTIDSSPPAGPTVETPGVNAAVKSSTPTVAGACETGARVTVYENSTLLCEAPCGAGAYACVSSYLADGVHVVVAQQTDPAGNKSGSSASRTFTVDTLSPGSPVVTSPTPGQQEYDGSTAFSGQAEPNSTVAVSVNGAPACTATADAQGGWQCTAAVPVGPSVATATATDAAGNTSGNSAGVQFTQRQSMSAPTVTSPGAAAQLTGPTVEIGGRGNPNSVVTVTDETGTVVCAAVVDASGAWTCTAPFAPGVHTVSAQQKADGLTSPPSASLQITVLQSAKFAGGGCSAAGSSPVSMILCLIAVGMLLSRARATTRRLAKP